MRKICFIFLAVVAVICTACHSSPAQSEKPTIETTAPTSSSEMSAPPADSGTFEPDAESVEAWKLRRAAIGRLVQEGKTVHKPAYLSVERNGMNEITLIFLAVRGNTISVFFDGEVVDDISYYTGGRAYTTYPCLPVVDAPGSDECVDSADEATTRFSVLIKQFDKYAREAFHEDYNI